MKSFIKFSILLLTITNLSLHASEKLSMQCNLKGDSRQELFKVSVSEDLVVTFSKDIGIEKATTNLFSTEGLPLFITSETLDSDGKELFKMLCNVDVDQSDKIEAMVLNQDFEAVCMECP